MSDTINKWSRSAFNLLIWLGVPASNIICFGRSIGTGQQSSSSSSCCCCCCSCCGLETDEVCVADSLAVRVAGPAAHLAATLHSEGIDVGGVVLHAPYISVHKIVAGKSLIEVSIHLKNSRRILINVLVFLSLFLLLFLDLSLNLGREGTQSSTLSLM